MRIFWWQDALHLEPKSQDEANMMVAFADSTKWGRNPRNHSIMSLKPPIIRLFQATPSLVNATIKMLSVDRSI